MLRKYLCGHRPWSGPRPSIILVHQPLSFLVEGGGVNNLLLGKWGGQRIFLVFIPFRLPSALNNLAYFGSASSASFQTLSHSVLIWLFKKLNSTSYKNLTKALTSVGGCPHRWSNPVQAERLLFKHEHFRHQSSVLFFKTEERMATRTDSGSHTCRGCPRGRSRSWVPGGPPFEQAQHSKRWRMLWAGTGNRKKGVLVAWWGHKAPSVGSMRQGRTGKKSYLICTSYRTQILTLPPHRGNGYFSSV